MPFQLSPGVAVVEKDFSSIIPAVATSTGAFAGAFQWGPIEEPVTVSSENVLVQRFGKPTDANAQSFFTAANFLSYANNLLVVRADTAGARNAVATKSGTVTGFTFADHGNGYSSTAAAPLVTIGAPNIAGGIQATGTAVLSGGGITDIQISSQGSGYTTAPEVEIIGSEGGVGAQAHAELTAGAVTNIVIDQAGSGYKGTITVNLSGGGGQGASIGNVVVSGSSVASITIVNHGTGYTTAPSVTIDAPPSGNPADASSIIAVSGVKIKNTDDYLTSFSGGEGVVGEFAAKYAGALGNSIAVSMADSQSFSTWDFKASFDSAPGTSDYAARSGANSDELHVILIDINGAWTGTAGAVLEKFAYVSKASDAKKSDGTNNYYKDVINSRSQYIWWMDHPTAGTNWGNVAGTTSFTTLVSSYDVTLSGGVDDLAADDGDLMTAWAIFVDDSRYDIRLIPLGKASSTVANFVIGNVAEVRLDCVVFASPQNVLSGDVIIASGSTATDQIIAYRDELPSSSYAVLDSGYKYQYDRYNDKYRWVPLNGDVAGLCARVDYQADPWFSPGGLNRGQIKNVVKLAVSPNQADRDNLYKNGINPVVTFPGQGTVLYGDKTLLAKPSAFDRINVRRLFIVLEKAIATAAKFQLFEFNDSFTQAQFRNLVEPFLRDVQGRRGITEFVVKCDASNNTAQVVDSNQFVADIYIKPNRSINFITLNFIAARSSISFSEIGGSI